MSYPILFKKDKYTIPVVIILLFVICFLYLHNLTGWLINGDEGGYLNQSWRMSRGEVPYKDFYSPKEPLFLLTGWIIFKLFGPAVLWVRMFTVIVTILTGYLIFLIGRRIYNSDKVAILSLIIYLILPVVYFQARLYRPDAYEVFFSTLGLFLFIKAWQENKRPFFLYSGIFYAISLGYKLGATLGIIALLMFVLYQAFIEKSFYPIKHALVPFIIGFLGIAIPLLIIIHNAAPSFLNCVIGHQIHQPLLAAPHLLITVTDNIKYLLMINPRQYGIPNTHSWIIFFSFPLIIGYLFIKKDLRKIFTFYIFNISWLLLTPYESEIIRYLLYFLPVAVLVFANIILYPFDRNKGMLVRAFGIGILVFALIKIFIPGLIKDYGLSNVKESGTLAFAKYIRENTVESDYVVADYGDIIFHARRKTTPLMMGMSRSAVVNGVITSNKLIAEFEKYSVKMILIHREGGVPKKLGFLFGTSLEPDHFSTLINSEDGIKFLSYLKNHYKFMANFNRTGQIFDVYIRK